jgi:hypothetical protein
MHMGSSSVRKVIFFEDGSLTVFNFDRQGYAPSLGWPSAQGPRQSTRCLSCQLMRFLGWFGHLLKKLEKIC